VALFFIMIDLETLKAAILTNNFTDEQLVELYQSVKTARINLRKGIVIYVPPKFDRIAVVLIGHSRHLNSSNDSQHKFIKLFNRMANQVDYYILSWINQDYNTEIKTSKRFKTSWPNKFFYKLYDEDNLDFNRDHKIMKLSWLAKQAAEQIKIVQDNLKFNYDYVIESRVDQLVEVDSFRKTDFTKLNNNEILANIHRKSNKSEIWNPRFDSVETFEFDHWYFRMNPKTYLEFSDRFDFFYQKKINTMWAGPILPKPHKKDEARELGFDYHTGLAYYFLEKKFTFSHSNHDWDL